MTIKKLGIGAALCLCLLLFLLLAARAHDTPSAAQSVAEPREPPPQFAPLGSDDKRTILSPHEAGLAAQAKLMPAGTKSILAITSTLKHGEFVWDDRHVPPGEVHVWVDLRRQTISVFRSGHEIGSALIAYGAHGHDTPLGRFAVVAKFRHYRSRRYGAEMPYSLFINDDGVALHSSNLNPRHATHGCVGLPEAFARKLFDVAQVGTPVEIITTDPDLIRLIAEGRT